MIERSEKRSEQSGGPDQLLAIWRRRKWIGLSVAALGFAAAATAALSLPNLYRASATVIVERQQVSEEYVKTSVTDELETRIQTIHQRVTSYGRLSDLITRLRLYADDNGTRPIHTVTQLVNVDAILRSFGLRGERTPVPMAVLVDRFRKDIELSLKGVEQTSGRRSTIAFTLGFSGTDPKAVAEVANTLAAFYVGENTQSRERQAVRTAEFLKTQLGDAKKDLDARQRQMSAYKSSHDGELQPFEVNVTALERLNTRLTANADAQARANERRQRLEEQIAGFESGAPVAGPPTETPITVQLSKARRELAELQKRFSDRYPDVIKKKGEIAVLEQEVNAAAEGDGDGGSTTRLLPTPSIRLARQSIADVDRELKTLKAEEASIKQTVAGYEGRLQAASRRQQEFQQLSRGYDTVNERYQTLVKRADDAQAAETLEQGQNTEQFRILDPAIVPIFPAGPSRMFLLVIGLLAALGLGTGAIVIAEKLDTTLRSIEELRTLTSVPVLARIRLIPTPARSRHRQLRFAVLAAATLAGLVVIVAGTYYFTAGNEQIVRLMARPVT